MRFFYWFSTVLVTACSLIADAVADNGHVDASVKVELTNNKIAAEDDNNKLEGVYISKDSYEKMVYFSKICALTYCISTGRLEMDKTFFDGGCPADLDFCSNEEFNPSIRRTRVELILEADEQELGTGYVAVDHEREVVMLAFRGSSTRQDWFSDFEIYPTQYKPISTKEYKKLVERGEISACHNCMIHKGFYRFIETLSKDFLQRVERIFKRYPDYNLVVTGHSLGAALASICGIELKLRGYNPLILTYATPKIFNEEMKQWVNDLFDTKAIHEECVESGEVNMLHGYFRVIHLQDYIPMVPPGYKAAGLEIFITKPELPHEIHDLEYRAVGSGATWKKVPMNKDSKYALMSGIGHWLHMDEHRKYFILINSCSGF
ncbi:hypothetical protein KDRO_D04650 [Kluyveromyces lactis]|nr:hypothetical protein KDRO_D04650 [Kluyveromyces lactis]